jgi:transposase InsO family protein
LWREEGLRVPQRQRLGTSAVPAKRLRAHAPDHVWALDYQFDQTADGRILKLLHVVDEFTREALAIECHRRIDADKTVATLERLVAERGSAPAFIRCDNGPELTANALRDWCRFARAGSAYIEPGSPWQNPYVESFGSRMDQWGWEQLGPWLSLRLELPVGALFCVIDGRTRGRPLTASNSRHSCDVPRHVPVCDGASHPTSCVTRTRSRWPERACR